MSLCQSLSCFLFKLFMLTIFLHVSFEDSSGLSNYDVLFTWAIVNVTYTDPRTRQVETGSYQGKYGTRSLVESRTGVVVHARTQDNSTHGCDVYNVTIPAVEWIALVQRGVCYFTDKIQMAVSHNASAVVVYNSDKEGGITIMQHTVDDFVSIFVTLSTGAQLAELVDSGVQVMMTITPGHSDRASTHLHIPPDKTSRDIIIVAVVAALLVVAVTLTVKFGKRWYRRRSAVTSSGDMRSYKLMQNERCDDV